MYSIAISIHKKILFIKLKEDNQLKKILKDVFNNIWVFVGMFIAWLVMEGSARTIVGYIYVGAVIVWFASYKIRHLDDKSAAK